MTTPASQKQLDYLTDTVQIEKNRRRVWNGLTAAQSSTLIADMQTKILAEVSGGIDSARASELINAAKSLQYGPKNMLKTLGYTQETISAVLTPAATEVK